MRLIVLTLALVLGALALTHAAQADDPRRIANPNSETDADRAGVSASNSTAATAAPAQPAQAVVPIGVPSGRAAKNVAIITIHEGIDEWTARSVRRRLKEAAASGADAVVLDIDTPGGEMSAMLAIAGAIKSSPIRNTVAWINPNAYSAGAVIALACKEIVVSDASALGDALPIEITTLGMLKPIPDAEREKFLGPILAEVIDSARANGHDEVLVQGFVRRGVELWLVEHSVTGQRVFVTASQYEQAVGKPAQRSQPTVGSATGPIDSKDAKPLGGTQSAGDAKLAPSAAQDDGMGYVPAAPNVSPTLVGEVNDQLRLKGRKSGRLDLFSAENAGQFREVEYVSNGHGVLTFRSQELLRYRLAQAKVSSEDELKSYFGASNLATLDESWSEGLARFLSLLPVKGVLLVVFLLALFIEMTHPGVILPGVVAMLALAGLMIPPLLVNLSAWWMGAAVVAGIGLLLLEVFVIPGFGLPGVLGLVLLLGGLVGTFVGGTHGLFPGPGARSASDPLWGVTTLLLSIATSIGLMVLASRNLPRLPIFNRLISKNDDDDVRDTLLGAMAPSGALKKGATGVAVTSLRPAGRVKFGESVVDVVADIGYVEVGTPVRVIASDEFRTIVAPIENAGA